jgi:hypothetical protein
MRLNLIVSNQDETERYTKTVRAVTVAHNRYPATASQHIDDAGIVQDVEIFFGRNYVVDATDQQTIMVANKIIERSVYTYSADLCMALSALQVASHTCHSTYAGLELTLKGLHPTLQQTMPISLRVAYDEIETNHGEVKGKFVMPAFFISIGGHDMQHFSSPAYRWWPVLAALKGIYA